MKTIVFTLFLVHSSSAIFNIFNFKCPECGCKRDFKYDLDVTLKRGETVCEKKIPIKEGWKLEEDRFECIEEKAFKQFNHLIQDTNENPTFNLTTGDSRIPTKGKYHCCLYAKCVKDEECTVTLTKNGGDEDLLKVVSPNGNRENKCDTLELDDKDRIQVNLISIGNVDACLDTDEKDNNRLTCKLEKKLGDV